MNEVRNDIGDMSDIFYFKKNAMKIFYIKYIMISISILFTHYFITPRK